MTGEMTRSEMIEFLKSNPHVRVKHILFSVEEYLYSGEDGRVYDENGYLFEDWHSHTSDGIRARSGGQWEHGWSLYHRKGN